MTSPAAPTLPPVERMGLTEVYTPPSPADPLVDLVFVHGLNGHPARTWTSQNTGIYWPSHLLPSYIEEEKVRIMVYGFDADVTSVLGQGVTKDRIHHHAEDLVAKLVARRGRRAAERPIIFVAHSLGGLVVKRAIIHSLGIQGQKTEHLRSIGVSTYGILFLATPHTGSDLGDWGSYLEWLCSAVVPKKALDTAPQLVNALKTNSETLQNIDRQFTQYMDNFHLFFFHEAKPTNLKGTLRFVVDEESAAPNLPDVERAGIPADHAHMCKFDSENSPGFDVIQDAIQRYAADAPRAIEGRWVAEKADRSNHRKVKANELYPGSVVQENSPHSEQSSTFHATPGKTQQALPAPETRPAEWEFTEVEERDVDMA